MRAAVRDYIARTSPRYGALTAARLVQAMGLLPQFPESGRILPVRVITRPSGS
jgi:hypothetical protein